MTCTRINPPAEEGGQLTGVWWPQHFSKVISNSMHPMKGMLSRCRIRPEQTSTKAARARFTDKWTPKQREEGT
ncbi:unnamed protein product [Protopolystoma xenopodis]|uniref:Uncharacterized protein n=1 Tax=Protopolystoma xenopodis TaxID=117903 RepID=A0A448XSC8_9PLAT|nr:unnamed protein product [Protopolystoma xenopodis]